MRWSTCSPRPVGSPPYSQVGIWAGILLVAVRVVHGLAFGAEWSGAILMTFEHTGDDSSRRESELYKLGAQRWRYPVLGVEHRQGCAVGRRRPPNAWHQHGGPAQHRARRDPAAWMDGQGWRITTDIADALAARYQHPLPALLNDTMRKPD